MTIKDIARLSGCGVATVSRVLNGSPEVSGETRRRVMAVVQAHGFRPNANAKRLKLQTPCALTGVCNQAECGDDCMCRVTAVLERPPRGREITVIFTEEALGY